jgi:hypothetical protein
MRERREMISAGRLRWGNAPPEADEPHRAVVAPHSLFVELPNTCSAERSDDSARRNDHSAERNDHSARYPHHSARCPAHSARRSHHSARRNDHSARCPAHSARRSHHSARRSHHSARCPAHSARRSHHSARRSHHSARRNASPDPLQFRADPRRPRPAPRSSSTVFALLPNPHATAIERLRPPTTSHNQLDNPRNYRRLPIDRLWDVNVSKGLA